MPMTIETVAPEIEAQDALDAAAIREKASELNALIVAANQRGLYINFGMLTWCGKDDRPSRVTVAIGSMMIERPHKWVDA